MNKKTIVYDLEIIRCIESKQLPRQEGLDFCGGWSDHAGMGVAVLTCYDYFDDRYRVFMDDNLSEFALLLANREVLVGFNNINFDNKVIVADGIIMPVKMKQFDILREVWAGVGLNPDKFSQAHGGFGLDELARVNFDRGKTGHGELAPVQWQHKQYGTVTDYCLQDTALTRMLLDRILERGSLLSPKTNREIIISPTAIEQAFGVSI